MAKADQEVTASVAQLGTSTWGAEAQGRGKQSNLLCSVSALQSRERLCAPWPARFPLLSLKDIPRLGCGKGMRCLSSRGLAESTALWRASSSMDCCATGHCSSTEPERISDMSSSPSQKKIRAEGLRTTCQQASFGQMSVLPEVAVPASTHQNG